MRTVRLGQDCALAGCMDVTAANARAAVRRSHGACAHIGQSCFARFARATRGRYLVTTYIVPYMVHGSCEMPRSGANDRAAFAPRLSHADSFCGRFNAP